MGPQVRASLFCDKQLLHVYSNKAPFPSVAPKSKNINKHCVQSSNMHCTLPATTQRLLIVICYADTMLIITREVDHKKLSSVKFLSLSFNRF